MLRQGIPVVAALTAASALAVLMVEIRTSATGDSYYRFLVWNLFLAWLPFGFAVAAYLRARQRTDFVVLATLALWLLFFPNAPYLLTDFVHLAVGPVPLWYDAMMISAFAWTGLMLGFASLYLVQRILSQALGPMLAWLGVLLALGLASIGVYIGRFIRFNSWDALLHPQEVAAVVREHLASVPLRTAEALVALTAFLAVGYFVVYTLSNLRLEADGPDAAAPEGLERPGT
jgi:uncharacterized membrane protein